MVLCFLNHSLQFIADNDIHSFKDLDNISRSLLKRSVINKSGKFTEDSLGPTTDLIVNNVNSLEFLLSG
jgi:hypothetical protein